MYICTFAPPPAIYIVFIVEVEGLIAKLTSRPKAEMLIRVNAEAEGRGINER